MQIKISAISKFPISLNLLLTASYLHQTTIPPCTCLSVTALGKECDITGRDLKLCRHFI